MNNILETIKSSDPFEQLYGTEFNHMFLSFCSLACLLHGKKMNLANIFILLMKDEEVRELYKMLTDTDSDYEALSSFLKYDPSLYKSKYIKNFLSANDVNLLK
jgi:hypothetical protein